MNILYVLIPLALLLSFGFLAACLWAIKSGQYDDLDTTSMRLIVEEPQRKDTES